MLVGDSSRACILEVEEFGDLVLSYSPTILSSSCHCDLVVDAYTSSSETCQRRNLGSSSRCNQRKRRGMKSVFVSFFFFAYKVLDEMSKRHDITSVFTWLRLLASFVFLILQQRIVQLLHQIAQMNELLVKHHKDIVSRR